MIKSYKDWKNDQDGNRTAEHAYNAALAESRKHYEEEHAATLEYAHSVMSRTSDITFDIAAKLCELADAPMLKVDFEKEQTPFSVDIFELEVYEKLLELKFLLIQHGDNNE